MYNRKNRKAGSIRQDKQLIHAIFVKPRQAEKEGIHAQATKAGMVDRSNCKINVASNACRNRIPISRQKSMQSRQTGRSVDTEERYGGTSIPGRSRLSSFIW
jgi:hypothetical protein